MRTRLYPNLLFLLGLLLPGVALAAFPAGADAGATAFSKSPSRWLPAAGSITGVVTDATDGSPVAYATVSLYTAAEALVNGTLTDEAGRFTVTDVADGTYRVEITFLGYEKISVPDVTVAGGKATALGTIKLGASAELLEEVTVTGQRSLIEEKVDRLVYNAEQDKLSKGGDAADVLRRVPLLQVDLEGNVSLRGNSNIRVLINNKPSTIIASSVADAMKMIPADQIKSVEVITSPSAKYDAEGSGGIINIITQKNSLAGYFLNVDTGLGLRGSNLGLNGSYRKGKFGLTLGGFGRAFYNDAETSLVQQFTDSRSEQFGEASDNGMFGRYNLGLDYDLTDRQFLSAGIRFGLRNFNRDQLQTTSVYANEQPLSTFLRDIESERTGNSIDLNLDYLYVIKAGRELSVSTLYSTTDENTNFVSSSLNGQQTVLNRLQNLNDNNNQEITLQTDYIHPIGETQIVEAGAKGILRQVNSDYRYLSAEGEGAFTADGSRPAGQLDYGQDIVAAYGAYTLSLPGEVTVKAGMRYEQTRITATQDNEAIEIPDYDNFVPSLNLSKRVGQATTVKAAYSRRIQRPWLRQLNPNVNLENTQNIEVGNPLLRPELTDNYELGYSSMLGKTYLNLSLFGRNTANAINEVRTPIDSLDGTLLTTYENIGQEQAVGMNVFLNLYLTNRWTVNGGFDLDYARLEGLVTGLDGISVTQTNSGFNYGGRLMSQLKMNNGWSAQAFTFMRGRRVQLQGSRGGFGMYALGVSKEINEGRGTIGLSAENFAGQGWTLRSELETASFTQVREDLLLNRNVKLTFSYKFGELEADRARRKTRGVSNDDLMGGGDDGGGGAAASPAPTQSRRAARRATAPVKKDKKAKQDDKEESEEEKQ
ncbi:outer membrane receptor protein involved in Fe transport [Lewinella marina]|uniref:TonB-dependent receptor n=1 Tax=Neolewinella marina TaxID=438751 RepID=A0A2G0CK59_9BACT|nr:TonB-dependent receptor [Neolewinella marina]NJB84448.1 outer membrane receptor protein involved in Fe transport [Neolewinella marina]PHL00359.1 TonB-dependent receptor [Neolewinella marina]